MSQDPLSNYSSDGPISSNTADRMIESICPIAKDIAAQIKKGNIIVSNVVIPNLMVLLGETLGAIDAAIPNKDQNRAVKHIIRTSFDRTYFDILRRAYPEAEFAQGSDSYALRPEPDRNKAFASTNLKAVV